LRILAIDTALSACSVCVYDSDSASALASESERMERGHAEALVPMLERVLTASGLDVSGLDRVAVTVGPGSFTGLRVGLSSARALGLAAGIPVVGVSTLSAFAAPAIAPGATLTLASTVDARHGNLFLQIMSPSGRMIVAPRAASLPEAARLLGGGSVRIVGTAARVLAVEAEMIGTQVYCDGVGTAPDITWVARLGLVANPDHAPALPLYLRDPDARPQDHTRLPRRDG
jgi:tRNA threonylcarbamoyladenosine biosynthesis protein TsaB